MQKQFLTIRRFASILLTVTLILNLSSTNVAIGILTLDSCYQQARQQFPLIQQKGLIEQTKDFNVSNASKGYYPQFNLNGQVTTQSAVTQIPLNFHIPGVNLSIPTLPLNQFNIHGEITENIYDGGAIADQKAAFKVSAEVQQQNIEVQLYALRDRVTQLYFGILLIEEQLRQNDVVAKDIRNSIAKVEAGVAAGTALKSGLTQLQAKLLQQDQNKIELLNTKRAYVEMLGVFIHRNLDTSVHVEVPKSLVLIDSCKRPEISLYALQQKNDDVQIKSLQAAVRPKLSLFFQGGYALPGLNAFDVDAQAYYVGGARLSWNFGGYYTLKNQKKIIELDKQSVAIQKEVFLFNTRITLRQQNAEVQKLLQLISKDNEIINKLTEVKNSSKNQMDAGVLTVHEYISDVDAEDQAKQTLLLHHVQLLLNQYNYQNTTGNL